QVPYGPALSTLALVWALTLLNLRGVHAAGHFQVATTIIKLLPLLLVIAIAASLLAGSSGEIAPFEPQDLSIPAVSGAAALTLWALLGFEAASAAAERVRDPELNIPRATMWGTAVTGLVYLFVCSAAALMLPQEVASSSPAPLATFVERYWSAGPAVFVTLCAIVSCVGAANGWILIQGEMPRNLACKGQFPYWFAATDGRGTPRRALVAGSALASVLLMINAGKSTQGLFEFLLLVTTSAALWFYLVLAMAAWKLRIVRPFALAGAAYAIWTLWGAGLEADAWSIALVLAGLPVWWWTRRNRAIAEPA
ncbi:MAG TPA: APC family permease, partial [Sphingomonadaceae bacterium]|nr:APC family permease [Sphingomonadaceae bacterium]